MDNLDLINIAKKSLKNSYSPYSEFKVGASILCSNGDVYFGCNIENASYGATVCAERVAIFNAISKGNNKFEKIAIVSKSSNDRFKSVGGGETFPCGICLQVMSEFKIKEVILQDKEENIKVYKLADLLPNSFDI